MKRKILAALTSLCMTLGVFGTGGTAAFAAGRNLISNPGFELGATGYEGSFETAVHNDTALYSGRVPADKFAKQVFSGLLPNTEYVFSAWVFLEEGTLGVPTVTIKGYGGADIYNSSGSYAIGSWAYIETPFTTGETVGDVEISVWNTSGNAVYVDDMSLTSAAITDGASGMFAAKVNLWKNPGFEDGTTDGYAADGSIQIAAHAVFAPHGGANTARLACGGYVKQTVSGLKPNTTYTLYAQMYLTKNSPVQPQLAALCPGNETVTGGDGAHLAGSWSRDKLIFTTGEGTTAQIAVWNSSACEVFVDDLILSEGADPNVANRIRNPGFETGDYTGWMSSGVVVDNNQNSGNYCVQVDPDRSAEQEVTGLTVGETYVFSAYVKADTGAVLGVKGNGYDYNTTVVSENYVKASVTFTAAEETARFYLWKPWGPGALPVWGDDFALSSPSLNLCTDPSFESGGVTQYEGAFEVVDNNVFPPRSGKYSAKVTQGNSVLKRFDNLKPNTEYTFAAWVYITKAEVYPDIVVKGYGGADIYSKVFSTPGKWLQNVLSFRTGPDASSAEISVWNSTVPGGDIYVDDVLLVAPKDLVGFGDLHMTEDKFLEGVAPGTTVDQLISAAAITNSDTQLLVRRGSAPLGYEETVGTGDKIDILFEGVTVSTYTALVYGDLNGDGNVNILDAVLLKRELAGFGVLQGEYLRAAKLAGGGAEGVTTDDFIQLKSMILG